LRVANVLAGGTLGDVAAVARSAKMDRRRRRAERVVVSMGGRSGDESDCWRALVRSLAAARRISVAVGVGMGIL
jgi:hypothetical protein